MGPIDYILIAVILAVVALAVLVIYRAKKSGQKCVGCPHSKTCSGGCGAHLPKTANRDTIDPPNKRSGL